MSGRPIPDPRAVAMAEIERKIADFFGTGRKAFTAPGFEPSDRPARSEVIDPETVLKRRRPSPTRAERQVLRKMADSL